MKRILIIIFLFTLQLSSLKAQDTIKVNVFPKVFQTLSFLSIDVQSKDTISALIYNRFGEIASTVLKDTILPTGKHTFKFGNQLTKYGIYLLFVSVNHKKHTVEPICKYQITDKTFAPTVYFPNIDNHVGHVFEIPIFTSAIKAEDNKSAYQLQFKYDTTQLAYIKTDTCNTLSKKGMLESNAQKGVLSIAYAQQAAICGEGILLNLKFRSLNKGISNPKICNFLFDTDTVKLVVNMPISASYLYGDIDLNNSIQAKDASLALEYSVNPQLGSNAAPWISQIADVDGISGITAMDASLILKYIVGLTSSLGTNKKNLTFRKGDLELSMGKDTIIIKSKGEIEGLNIKITNNTSNLLPPIFLYQNALTASYSSSGLYSLGMAMAQSPAEGTPLIKIPLKQSLNRDISIEACINNETQRLILGTAMSVGEALVDGELSVYPNPFESVLSIQGNTSNILLTVYDSEGKQIVSQIVSNGTINLEYLHSGIYTFEFKSKDRIVRKKIIKK